MRIGHPTRSPNATTFRGSSTSSRAGVTGTPDAESALRAAILSPRIRMTRADGPMKTSPSRSTASAKSGFSARNPYPGKIASQPESFAARRTASMSR